MDMQLAERRGDMDAKAHAPGPGAVTESGHKRKSRSRRGRRRRGKRRRGKKANEPPPFLPPEVNLSQRALVHAREHKYGA